MSTSSENLEKVNNALDINNVKGAWLNYTSALYKLGLARATLLENLSRAAVEDMGGLIGEQVKIPATEWFQKPGTEDEEKFRRHTAGPDHDFTLLGEFCGVTVFDENMVENLEPNHKPDAARLCLLLRRSGSLPGDTLIPREALTDGIALAASTQVSQQIDS